MSGQKGTVMKDLVLYTKNGQVYVKLDKDYMLHVTDTETLNRLSASKVILLVNATIEEHTRQTVQ